MSPSGLAANSFDIPFDILSKFGDRHVGEGGKEDSIVGAEPDCHEQWRIAWKFRAVGVDDVSLEVFF